MLKHSTNFYILMSYKLLLKNKHNLSSLIMCSKTYSHIAKHSGSNSSSSSLVSSQSLAVAAQIFEANYNTLIRMPIPEYFDSVNSGNFLPRIYRYEPKPLSKVYHPLYGSKLRTVSTACMHMPYSLKS